MLSIVYIQNDSNLRGTGLCGGTLIAPDMVLTASHCLVVDGYTVENITAFVNRSSWVETTNYEYQRNAKTHFVHPDYNFYQNDIAVVQLDSSVTGVPLVKLNRNASLPSTGQSLTAIGLGNEKWNGVYPSNSEYVQDYSDYLRDVSIDTVSYATCQSAYGSFVVHNHSICAGGDVKGVCLGDSGGPLLLLTTTTTTKPRVGTETTLVADYHRDVQMGVTSFGGPYGCGLKGWPNGFTRVSFYVNWIDSMVCRYSKNKPATCPTTATRKPTAKKMPNRKPTTKVPTRKATTKMPTRTPTTKMPTRKPTTMMLTRTPTSKMPTRKPTTKMPTRTPTTKMPTRKPTTKMPTREPTTSKNKKLKVNSKTKKINK